MGTTANQKLRLKKPNGWFPSGDGFLEAITVLSDGAFKLFVFVCLHADRRTATYSASTRELGRVVGKSHRWVQTYITELQVKGLCSSLPTRVPYREHVPVARLHNGPIRSTHLRMVGTITIGLSWVTVLEPFRLRLFSHIASLQDS